MKFRVKIQYADGKGARDTSIDAKSVHGAKRIATRRFGHLIHPSTTWHHSKVYGTIKRGRLTDSGKGWIQLLDASHQPV